jgi:hypothetical protein
MSGIRITTRVTDERQVLQSGKRLGAYFGRLSDARVRESVEGAQAEIQVYPPEIPDQTYERTGTLGRSWRIVHNETRSYTLMSDAQQKGRHYTHYVVGRADGTDQAFMHVMGYRGLQRWKLIRDVAQRWARHLLESVNADLDRILRGEGMGL